ncbi:DUF2169 domain-containing protein [Pantoea sp. B65]|uniref:DUF2169 family type VI secretion system accessory protein n=1 Tax=Pantoea sp. B65 TaxID=2813359 RepID=UPI0039B68A3B
MKIIKPLRLSVLNRPFRWQGKNQLGISLLALTDMSSTPQLRPESELWQLAASELTGSGGVLDLALPKACAEFLASGNAYTRHQQEKTVCTVKIEVAGLSKSLRVSGDRHWINGQPSPPRPFEQMCVDWRRAYGGEGYADNPQGIGLCREDGAPLPNIEALSQCLPLATEKPEPASFGPLDMLWPRRFTRIGTQYDAGWLQQDFPGFARDTDWRLFNAASEDQWWPDRASLPAQARWRIWNMHPQQPLLQGTLPPWRARCFINHLQRQQPCFAEVPLRATTVWFFPHLQQMLLIWQGSMAISEDDAADVLQILPALEKCNAPRSLRHYQQVLQQRLDKQQGALFALREKDLLPEEAIGPWLDTQPPAPASAFQANMLQREHNLREQQRARLAERGQDIDQLFPPRPAVDIPPLDELPALVARLEQQAGELRAQAEQRSNDYQQQMPSATQLPCGAEGLHQMHELLHRHQAQFSEKQHAGIGAALHQIYLMSALSQDAPPRLSPETQAIIRNRVRATMALSGDFSGLDLTGADLSQLDLRGANFSRALLENANFSHSQLSGANFTQAVLVRAEFNHSSVCHAVFDQASLAAARCRHSDFSGAHFFATGCEQASFAHCQFAGASFSDMALQHVRFEYGGFQQATLDNLLFLALRLVAPDFSAARLNKVSFMRCNLQQALFSGAQLTHCSLVETQAIDSHFCGATLLGCAFPADSNLQGADFTHATLSGCNLRQLQLERSCFRLAKLENSDLSEAHCRHADMTRSKLAGCLLVRTDLRDASLVDSDLTGALLPKSQLSGARLQGANLFRADISQALINAATQLSAAYTRRIKTLPTRDREPG